MRPTRRLRRDAERGALGLVGIGGLDEAGLRHAVDHPVAALDGALALAERIVVVRRLRQRREISDFRDGELVDRLVEVDERGGGDAVGAQTEIDLVQVQLDDLVLRVGALDLERQQRFLDLTGERDLVGQKEVLGDLLRDGRGALRPAVRAEVLRVVDRGACDAGEVQPAVLVEVLVLGREEAVDHQLRHRLDRDVKPALARVFGDQRAVAGVHARHHRRLVVLELRVIRQVLGEMPEQPGRAGDADHEQDGPCREQEAEEAQQELHE